MLVVVFVTENNKSLIALLGANCWYILVTIVIYYLLFSYIYLSINLSTISEIHTYI